MDNAIFNQHQIDYLANLWNDLNPDQITRNQAFGLVVNTSFEEGQILPDVVGDEVAKTITGKVLDQLGFKSPRPVASLEAFLG